MRELLRMEHAEGNRDEGSALRDYNMEISEGEILYIQGADGSGIREIAAVLAGDQPLFKGRIYIEEEKADGYSRRTAYEKRFYPVSSDGSMIDNLTVGENMEAVRDRRIFFRPYFSGRVERRVDDFLSQEGIPVSAGSPGRLLCPEEEVRLSILKAKLHGARLVMLELLNSAFEGSYAGEIGSLMEKLCREGISFIILASSYSPFAEIATRLQFVYRGRDLKEWTCLSREAAGLLKGRIPDSAAASGPEAGAAGKGVFIGMYDYEWKNDKSIWNYLEEVKRRNLSFWKQTFRLAPPEQGISFRQGVLVIPKDSGNLWFENLSIADNLLMPISEKIAGSRYGIVRRNRKEHIVNRFYDSFHIEKRLKEVRDLNKVQRKLFSIYRFELLHPETVFLENPYWGMDQEEILQIRHYLEELQKRGSRIVCCAKSIDEMKNDCSLVIQTDNAGNARIV